LISTPVALACVAAREAAIISSFFNMMHLEE
jgi:hypothetical protein